MDRRDLFEENISDCGGDNLGNVTMETNGTSIPADKFLWGLPSVKLNKEKTIIKGLR